MPYTSGTFALFSTGNPVVTGTTVSSTWANNTLNDIATGLSTAVLKDGTQTMTANIPMAGFKFTGLGAGSALTDSASIAAVQNGFGAFLTGVAGTNTITATATPTPSYAVGQLFTFIPAVTNTGAVTLNISSQGAGAVQLAGAALTGGELVVGRAVTVYVSVVTPVFEIIGISTATATTASTFTWDGSGGTSGSVSMVAQRVGNFVSLYIPSVTATSGTSSTKLTANSALPAAFRPSTNTQMCSANDILNSGGGVASPGLFTITTAGIVSMLRDQLSTTFTNSVSCGMVSDTTITYYVG